MMLTLALLFGAVGGVSSVNATPFRLSAKSFSKVGGNASYEDGKLKWKGTGDNVADAIIAEAGVIAQFSSIHFTCSGLTEGATYRVMLTTSDETNYIAVINKTGDVTVNFSELTKQWGSEHPSAEVLATVTKVRFGGGTDGSPSAESPYEITIDPTSLYVESESEVLSIATTADWTLFSKMVAAGVAPLDAQLTADVDAGSTMVGSETSGKRYKGTFDGAGYTLTFIYNNATAEKVAPFQGVEGATIKNLKTTGSITSSGNLPAGIAGQIYGTTTIENCSSDMALSTTATSNGRIGGLVSRCKESGAELTLSNCVFNGSLSTATTGAMICGLVGYSDGQTVNLSSCFVNPTSISGTGDQRFSHTRTSVNNCWYTSILVAGNGGTEATSAKLASGEVTYDLQNSQATQYWGQDLEDSSSSPMLTNNAAYKVFDLGGGEYANWDFTISDDTDWVKFSKIVAAGTTDMDVTMTADVDAGSTMVGTSTNPYQGTFDGTGHTLTFIYDGSTSNEIAPFQYINNATINNLTTTGSINAQNIFGGIVGTAGGASTLNYCTSNMVLTANHNGDSNNGRVAGLVGRCADNATPVGTSITFNNCMFGGSISSTIDSRCCGLVSWARSTTVIANNCLIAPKNVTNGAANIAATGGTDPVVTPTNCFYTKKFGYSNQGTQATAAQIASGELCYTLNESAVPSTTYFFGQGYLNSSRVEDQPSLTSDASKKVYKENNNNYFANANGALPDPALVGKLAWKHYGGPQYPYVLVLTAEKAASGFELVSSADCHVLKVTAAGATTLVLPYNVATLPENVKAYNLTVENNVVKATPVSSITADQPVLINAPEGEYQFSSGQDWNYTFAFDTHTSTTNGALTGVYNTSHPFAYVPKEAYVLQNGASGLGFYKVEAENTIKITSFRAYLTADISARSLEIVFDEDPTGIDNVTAKKTEENGAYFNLAGQRIAQPTKGLYIVNGKKVVIK